MTGISRRFRFGVLVSRADSLADWRETARRAEASGYSTLLIADHFGQQLAPVPALVSAAEATARLRVGTFVLDNDFRHPAAAAKEAATVDLLTDGRLEFGIGAGWNAADYTSTGIAFESAGTRVSRLQEALHIIKAFFNGGDASAGQVTFHGRHYQVKALQAVPRPVQRPRPPILLGAAGRRMLQLAAREADILNFPDRPSRGVSTAGNPALGITFDEQLDIVREAAGDRYSQLELSALCIPRITDDVAGTIDGLARQMQTSPAIVQAMPGALVGSLDSIADKLQANREQFDLSYAVIPGASLSALAPVVARLAGS
jgi:probable F420-dependent oxidoreductase